MVSNVLTGEESPYSSSQASWLNIPMVKSREEIYDFKELFGQGAFCKVHRAIYKPTNEEIAVKVTLINPRHCN